MRDKSHIYITTPVFYPSADPHLGHAFTVVNADCLKRYYSDLGYKCFLSVGTDEHGAKMVQCAEEAGIPVDKFVAANVTKFRSLWHDLGVKYDKFIRTCETAHKNLVRNIFSSFEETNQIYFDEWKGWYCVQCEEFFSYKFLGEKATVCKLGHPLNFCNESTFFLRAENSKAFLLKEYKDKEEFIYPSHYKKEMENNFIHDLDDLSISRSHVAWGIKTPTDPSHTIYVWFDALISYLTSLGYGRENSVNFQNYWENPDSKIIHIIGKEICRFHGIYWPIMLKNLGLRPFDTLLVHGWLLMNDEKMSKSKKNIIDPRAVLEKMSRDGLRLYLVRLNFFHDNKVSIEDIFSIHNTYLSNTLGNLISRFYGIMKSKFNYELPKAKKTKPSIEIDQLTLEIENLFAHEYEEFVLKNSIFSLVERVFELFRAAGKLIEKHKAYSLDPEDTFLKELVLMLYRLINVGTWLLSPILIDSAPVIFDVLNLGKRVSSTTFQNNSLFHSKKIKPLEKPLFPRLTYA